MDYQENVFRELYKKLKLSESKNVSKIQLDPFRSVKQEEDKNINKSIIKQENNRLKIKLEKCMLKSEPLAKQEESNSQLSNLNEFHEEVETKHRIKLEQFLDDSTTVFPCNVCLFETTGQDMLDNHMTVQHTSEKHEEQNVRKEIVQQAKETADSIENRENTQIDTDETLNKENSQLIFLHHYFTLCLPLCLCLCLSV